MLSRKSNLLVSPVLVTVRVTLWRQQCVFQKSTSLFSSALVHLFVIPFFPPLNPVIGCCLCQSRSWITDRLKLQGWLWPPLEPFLDLFLYTSFPILLIWMVLAHTEDGDIIIKHIVHLHNTQNKSLRHSVLVRRLCTNCFLFVQLCF